MPYNSGTGAYERRSTTVIDASPDGDTVYIAIDAKLDQAADDTVTDLNHHKENGNHYPATSVHTDSRFLKQSPAGSVTWADGVPAPDAALKDFSNVAEGGIPVAKLASGITPEQIAGVAYVKTNILGAVSQSGGVPTGEIIERGSNANGSYTRFADGTQVCSHRASASSTADVAMTFPAAFTDAPHVVTSANSSYINAVVYSRLPTASSTAIASYTGSTSVRLDAQFSYLAIGRWF